MGVLSAVRRALARAAAPRRLPPRPLTPPPRQAPTELTGYHGAYEDFDAFDLSRRGQNFPEQTEEGLPPAVFFSSRPDVASVFAEEGARRARDVFAAAPAATRAQFGVDRFSPRVVPRKLRFTNPAIIDDMPEYDSARMAQILRAAAQNGNDGVIIRNTLEHAGERSLPRSDVYISLSGEAIAPRPTPPPFVDTPLRGYRNTRSLRSSDDMAGIQYTAGQNRWRVDNAVVEPHLRGQGRGVALYEELINRARAAGVPEIISDTEVTEDALNVYRALQRRGYDVEIAPDAHIPRGSDRYITERLKAPVARIRLSENVRPTPPPRRNGGLLSAAKREQ